MRGARFFSRWSKRKLNPRSEAALEHQPEAPGGKATPVQEAGGVAAETGKLPSLESLDEGSDYSGFLSPQVAEDVQRLALRKLFSSSRFNVRDGLDDYDEDYRAFESLGETITAEMRHRMERELDDGLSGDRQAEPKSPPIALDDEDDLVQSAPPHQAEDEQT